MVDLATHFELTVADGIVVHKKFPKIPRIENVQVHITEKLDGTNGVVYVDTDSNYVKVGSRNKWLGMIYLSDIEQGNTPIWTCKKWGENHGFLEFCRDNIEALFHLGDGFHYGEFVGPNINGNRYKLGHKQFFLFNHERHKDKDLGPNIHVVPEVLCSPCNLYTIESVVRLEKSFRYSYINNDVPKEGLMVHIPAFGHRTKIVWDKGR